MATIFRVENPTSLIGLWYNDDGKMTNFIKTLDNAKCRDLPMEFDPEFRKDGNWVSGCDSLETMQDWFYAQDVADLSEVGYGLYEFEVPDYRTYAGHAIFLREQATSIKPRSITLLDRHLK